MANGHNFSTKKHLAITTEPRMGPNGMDLEYVGTPDASTVQEADKKKAYLHTLWNLPDPAVLPLYYELHQFLAKSDKRCLFLQGPAACGKTTMITTALEAVGLNSKDPTLNSVDCAGMTGRELLWEIRFSKSTHSRLAQITEDAFGPKLDPNLLNKLVDFCPEAVERKEEKIHWNRAFSQAVETEKTTELRELINDIAKDMGLELTGGLGYEEKPGPLTRAFTEGIPILLDEMNAMTESTILNRVFQAINGEEAPITISSYNGEPIKFSAPDRSQGNYFAVLGTGNKGIENEDVNPLSGPTASRFIIRSIDSSSPGILQKSFTQRICQNLSGMPVNAILEAFKSQNRNLEDEPLVADAIWKYALADEESRKNEYASHPYKSKFLERPLELVEGANRLSKLLITVREKAIDANIENIVIDQRFAIALVKRAMEINPVEALNTKEKHPTLESFDIESFPQWGDQIEDIGNLSIANFGERVAKELLKTLQYSGFQPEDINEITEEARKLRIFEDESSPDVSSEYQEFWRFTPPEIEITQDLKDLAKELENYIREHYKEDITNALKKHLGKKPSKDEIKEAIDKIKVNPFEVKEQIDLAERAYTEIFKDVETNPKFRPIFNAKGGFDPNKKGSSYIIPALISTEENPDINELPIFDNIAFQLKNKYLTNRLFNDSDMHPFIKHDKAKKLTEEYAPGVDIAVMHYREGNEVHSGLLLRKDGNLACIGLPEVEALGIPNVDYRLESQTNIEEQEDKVSEKLGINNNESYLAMDVVKQIHQQLLQTDMRFTTPHLQVKKNISEAIQKMQDKGKNIQPA